MIQDTHAQSQEVHVKASRVSSESEGRKQWGVAEAFNVSIQSNHKSLLNMCPVWRGTSTSYELKSESEGRKQWEASPQGLARVVLTADVTVCSA